MVSTTLLLSLVVLAVPAHRERADSVRVGVSARAVPQLVVPTGIAVPVAQQGPSRAVADLFKQPAGNQAVTPMTDEVTTAEQALLDIIARPFCRL